MAGIGLRVDNEIVESRDQAAVLDREQLREVTLDDETLMREILAALVDDTKRQMLLLDTAIREQDAQRCMRLAHYSKGACANVGARGAATILKDIESRAANLDFPECQAALIRLAQEVELLGSEPL
jgi:HPt (histidine-containing phosphotransfer) domain-containing protein